MSAFRDLFSSDVGLLSAFVIAFTLGMGVYFVRFFVSHMREDEAKARER